MAEAFRSQALLPERLAGDVPATNQSRRLYANPFSGLPAHRPFALQAEGRATSKSLPLRSM